MWTSRRECSSTAWDVWTSFRIVWVLYGMLELFSLFLSFKLLKFYLLIILSIICTQTSCISSKNPKCLYTLKKKMTKIVQSWICITKTQESINQSSTELIFYQIPLYLHADGRIMALDWRITLKSITSSIMTLHIDSSETKLILFFFLLFSISVLQIVKGVPRICFLSGLSGEEMMMFIDAFPETGIIYEYWVLKLLWFRTTILCHC